MSTISRGQVTNDAAEIYEARFVPALFAQWAPQVMAAAGVAPGERVLDVACGTGVLAREALPWVQPDGRVTGIDCNAGMLRVARRLAPPIEWRQGAAEALPFGDGAFDAVVSQFGLMFFEDRVRALAEMWRVLAGQGRLVVAVWDRLEHSPGFAGLHDLLRRICGEPAAAELALPFALGETDELERLCSSAGIEGATISTLAGTARYPSIEGWLAVNIRGWTLSELVDDESYAALLEAAGSDLAETIQPDGSVAFAVPAHLIQARKG